MAAKIALLSNSNMNFIIRRLQREVLVYEPTGYGNELGILLDKSSDYYAFAPAYTFVLIDLMELLCGDLEEESAARQMEKWFALFASALEEHVVYYVSDAYLWGAQLGVLADRTRKETLEGIWLRHLTALCESHANVRIYPYRQIVEQIGEETMFSAKLWYLGRILFGKEAQERIAAQILSCLEKETRTPKKVLLLDLDNTLWGGLAGEAEHTPITLGGEHEGLAYLHLQRVILQMQRQGVLLGIVSKNNEEDALAILRHHPGMVLREDCFVAKRINWRQKHENIQEIAQELNLGLDSFVFWDDNPAERELVRNMLPAVTVADFPDRAEALPMAMVAIYEQYFAKPMLTGEDLAKTKQYQANTKRTQLQQQTRSFSEYLTQLQIVIRRVDAICQVDRIEQMVKKTNQFNLTTIRYDRQTLRQMLQDKRYLFYLYAVSDRFGEQGVVCLLIVDCFDKIPVIVTFLMSCRVMGKQIEQAVLADVESDLRAQGKQQVRALYVPTSKNQPVAKLYESLGYQVEKSGEDERVQYIAALDSLPKRVYEAKIIGSSADDRKGER